MKRTIFRQTPSSLLATAVAVAISAPASAYNLHSEDGTELNFDLEVIVGYFSSEESYGNPDSDPSWTEGYAKYGFSGTQAIGKGELFGAANVLTSGTRGDGDAAGLTIGDESETDFEDLYLGYRTGMFELSAGRQNLTIGDGFILNGDALNMGEGLDGIAPVSMDRGGAYWLAARKAFDQTAVLRFGGDKGLRSDLFWFESDNPAQASVEMAGINAEYVTDKGTYGLMYLEGLDVNDTEAGFWGYEGRDGQKTTSIRYQGNAGVENLFLAAEYVDQSQGNSAPDANAWHAEAGWTFADTPWSPSVNYRYTSYDSGYDPLFFGFNRGYGTWFQGEVAANYAGPFGTDADIHYLGVKANPTELLTVGTSYFDFSNTVGGSGDNDAREIDIWAEWVAMDHLIISPLVGFYTPDSASSIQGNDDTNVYAQLIAIVPF
ncbi:alginate export family protein [Vreelandella rituensis]|uniref:Alginate export domain-containing protein n=1 Tax=Vreelandella rituensis TaxID=2282306 RepID=A0A368TRF3_9GAMM|nr:alginate export family protein [Halomonas rituensis]RCV87234.1 hypothetical protein DU506_16975 [Halomonas rituensis]